MSLIIFCPILSALKSLFRIFSATGKGRFEFVIALNFRRFLGPDTIHFHDSFYLFMVDRVIQFAVHLMGDLFAAIGAT